MRKRFIISSYVIATLGLETRAFEGRLTSIHLSTKCMRVCFYIIPIIEHSLSFSRSDPGGRQCSFCTPLAQLLRRYVVGSITDHEVRDLASAMS